MNWLAVRRSAIRQAAVVAMLTTLVACTVSKDPPPAPVAVMPPDPGPPPGPQSYDGTYNGMLQLAEGNAMRCGSQNSVFLTVRNNAFTYVLNQPQIPWQPTRTFRVKIDLDGSFSATSGTAGIQGQVIGRHMEGQLNGDACKFTLQADRGGTW